MLKIQVFDARKPLETRELAFSSGVSIGRSPDRDIELSTDAIEAFSARIAPVEGDYYFTARANGGDWFYNEESVEIDRPYPLHIDDTLRVREYVLIVEEVPSSGRQSRPPRESSGGARKNPDRGNHRSLQQLKSRLSRKSSPETPPVVAVAAPVASTAPVAGMSLRCIGTIDETPDVRTFRFVASPPTRFSYNPGQFVTLKLSIDGKRVTRAYTISSAPSRPDVLEITVKRVPPPPDFPDAPRGLVSNWLHDRFQVGDSLQIEGIGGNFTPIERPDPKLLLLSAGSGITPMMSISRWVYDTGTARDIVFFHGARDRPDVIFARELQLLERRNPDFHLAISLTRCQDPGWRGATGRLDEKLLLAIAPDYRERAVYVCGPDSFMGGVKELLTSMDFPMANYHQESFGERKRVRGEKVEGGAVVVLARTGKEIVADGEGSLLELVEAEGIEIGSACRSGSCGTCKARLLEGRVSHDGEPSGLDREESERGYILPCIARPLERVVLDL